MKLPSSLTEKNIKGVVYMVLQMTLAVILFIVFCALSVDGKALDADPICGYDACPAIDPDALNVHIIPHSHDDVGWLKTPDQYFYQDVEIIISSVVDALKQNPERRFVQVETAFFKQWWKQQNDVVKQDVQRLVDNGQLEFINAAWSMNDEAAVHYQSTIDQFTLGLRYIQDNLGKCARPKVGWQIDPFGHSREQASLSAQLGFDSIFFARVDYRDKSRRLNNQQLDLLWRGSANLGNSTDIFASVLYNHYSAPGGFCFDIYCNDDVIVDDEESPDYNQEARVGQLADYLRAQAGRFVTNNILVTMGDDFRYEGGMKYFMNLDLVIDGFNKFNQEYDGKRIKVFYSTPSCYTKAVNEYVNANNVNFELKTDDFLPYADSPDTYWTGYFTSRATSKRLERQSSNLLQVAKQLAAQGQETYENEQITALKEIIGIMQHHDAITGTEKQHVADNYYFLLSRAINEANDAASQLLSNLISGTDANLNFQSCLLANVSGCVPTQSDQFTVVVYNPLSRTTTSTVSLPVYGRTNWDVVDPDGNPVDYQIEDSIIDFSYVSEITTSPNNLVFAAKEVPPFGFKVYSFTLGAVRKYPEVKPNPRVLIGYEDTSFEIDEATGLLSAVTMNGARLEVTQDWQYYSSRQGSGAYIFIPQSNDTLRVASGPVSASLITGNVSQGVIQEFGSWARQTIKVYNDDRSFIEIDWVIGPLDISDGVGKEVISKFSTSLATAGTFYTDSNGREVLKRTRNYRADYDYTDEQPVSGNYYPINTKIAIRDEDQGIELAVITDRSEGGSSINDGELEIMVHRACQSDDGRGVGEPLNEQQYGQGLVVRGKHRLVVGPISGNGEKSLTAIEKDVAQRQTLSPWVFFSSDDVSGSLNTLQFAGLTRDLPDNVNVLTLEPWDEGTVLLRLEHVLENGDDETLSQQATVDVSDLFTLFTVTELQEMSLGANMLLEENVRLSWPGSTDNRKTVPAKRDAADLTVALNPMEIRTFLAKITYT